MIWVVDGTRLKRDYPRFREGTVNFQKTNRKGYYFVDFPAKVFPVNWLGSSVPVVFDFYEPPLPNEPNEKKKYSLVPCSKTI